MANFYRGRPRQYTHLISIKKNKMATVVWVCATSCSLLPQQFAY